jgi:purine-binding chemotaxis protein CheW
MFPSYRISRRLSASASQLSSETADSSDRPDPRKGAMTALVKQQTQESNQFLTFRLDEQEYGLELFKIQEIRGYAPVTPIPNVPAHVRGVMNLRGTVLPVVDLRMKFRLPPIEYNKFTVIVIAVVAGKMVGLLVDAVSDVLNVAPEALRAAPDFGASVDTQFINGVFQTRDHLAVALNLERLLSESELAIPEAVN